jgi:cell wall assembly regulator SMI1
VASTIGDSWRSIERALRAVPTKPGLAPVAEALAAGATREQVQRAEAQLGVSLPSDLVDSYLLHQGQANDVDFVVGTWRLWKLEEIVDHHRRAGGLLEEPLIGFADNGGSTTLAIDASQGEKRGRIIELTEDGEDVLAPDFSTSWLASPRISNRGR